MENDIMKITKETLNDFFSQADSMIMNKEIVNTAEKFEELSQKDVAFYKISSLTYDDEYPRREAFENIITAMDNPDFSFVYILSGEKSLVELYVGVVKHGSSVLHASEYGKQLQKAFRGNFCGTEITRMNSEEINKKIFLKNGTPERPEYSRAGVVMGIPSLNDDNEKTDFQGIDRLINSMNGEKWRIVVVCEPMREQEIVNIKNDIYTIYSAISTGAKTSVQLTQNSSYSENESHTEGSNESEASGESIGYSKSGQHGGSDGRTHGSASNQISHSKSWSSTEQQNEGKSKTKTKGISENDSTGKSETWGKSAAISMEITNKKAQEALTYIDEELLERLKLGSSKGMFKTSVFYMTKTKEERQNLKSNLLSLFQGSKSSYSPLYACDMADKPNDADEIVKYNNTLQLITEGYKTLTDTGEYSNRNITLLHSRYSGEDGCELATMMTPKEISLIAGLPMNEVAGLNLKQGIEFGLNPDYREEINKDDIIELGPVIQRGQPIDNRKLTLSKKDLNRHVFIAGVTGSGKTTTCQKILLNSDMPWLVIEPAKTEYRGMIDMLGDKRLTSAQKKGIENIVVFTVGNEQLVPFRFNPFELLEGENISSHIDMLKATFTTAFPMEASMPQLLEEGIYRCYEKKGWDVTTNKNSYTDNPFDGSGTFFPIFSELLVALEEVVKEKNFGNELQQNYAGSLISRLSNLTVGSKGAMFNCPLSIDFEKLIDKNVIIEMEELKSQEDKALLMGFILTRLSVAVKKRHKEDKTFRHITLVEEAHRLLSKMEYGDSGSKKASVEMFTDMLAEVRKYGECLVVVDQIPNKLATEVMKNTNTKIIHRIFARDDKETVGDTMMMDDKQKMYLSSLGIGEAIVFTDGTDKPVHIKVDRITDTNDNEIEDEKILEQWNKECIKGELNAVINNNQCAFIPMHPMFGKTTKEIINYVVNGQINEAKFLRYKKDLEAAAQKDRLTAGELWGKLMYTAMLRSGYTSSVPKEQLISESVEFYNNYISRSNDKYYNEHILNYYVNI